MHEFLELLACARALPPGAAIEAYEAALALYKGDLLDSSDMPSYRWMYDEGPPRCRLRCAATTDAWSTKADGVWLVY